MKKEKKEKQIKAKMDPKKKKKIIKRSILLGLAVIIIGGIAYSSVKAKNTKPMLATLKIGKEDIEQSINTSGNVKSELSKTYFPPAEVFIKELNVELGEAVKKGDKLINYDADLVEYGKSKADLQGNSSSNGYKDALTESEKQQTKYIDAVNNLATVEPMIISQKQYIDNIETYLDDERSRERVKAYTEQYRLQKELNSLNEEAKEDYTEGVMHSMVKVNNQLEKLNLDLKLLEEDRELTQVERNIVKEKNKLTDLEEFKAKQESIRDASEPQILSSYDINKLKADNALSQLEAQKAAMDLEKVLEGVTAEFDGIVTELGIVEGSYATESTQVLTLESSNDVKISFNVSKYDLEKIAVGQKADITVSGHDYVGTVSKINRMATTNSAGAQVVAAEVHIDNPDDNIYLGVEGKVRIHTATVKDAVVIPVELVNADQQGDFCYVIENETVVKRRLVTGISSDNMMEVIEGLKEGDEVIASGGMQLEEGMPATAMPQAVTETEEGSTAAAE